MHPAGSLAKPTIDDRAVFNIVSWTNACPAVLVAHELNLFALLAEEPRTLSEICSSLGMAPRPAQAILSVVCAVGFLQLDQGKYSLTDVAREYLIESSPTYFGGFLDLLIANYSVYSPATLKKAVWANSSQAYEGKEIFKTHEERAEAARAFTRAMHGLSMAPALGWPEYIDLTRHRVLLDVGGGSGAHAIGAATHWPHLEAIIFDLAPVCEVAEEFVVRQQLQGRIRTHAGDLWTDRFPAADVHFYSQIFHDWPPDKCRFLAQKSFEGLPAGGRILVHGMLFDEEKTGPLATAAANIAMLLWTAGQEYSAGELSAILGEVGFSEIEVKPTFGNWSIVSAQKQ